MAIVDPALAEAAYRFVVEAALSSLVAFLLVLATFRLFQIREARVRAKFFLLPLLIPALLGAIFHLLVPAINVSIPWPKVAASLDDPETALLQVIAEGVALILLIGFALCLWDLIRVGLCRLHLSRQTHRRGLTYRRSEELLERLSSAAMVRPPHLVVVGGPASTAHAFGLFRPVILLSRGLARVLDDEELEAVLAHELTHVRGRDSVYDLLAKLGRDIMFFNPIVHIAYRAYVVSKEEAADDGAVELTHNPLALAGSLLKAWRNFERRQGLSQVALLGDSSQLERRVLRALDYRKRESQTPKKHLPLFFGLSASLTALLAVAW